MIGGVLYTHLAARYRASRPLGLGAGCLVAIQGRLHKSHGLGVFRVGCKATSVTSPRVALLHERLTCPPRQFFRFIGSKATGDVCQVDPSVLQEATSEKNLMATC